MKSTAPLTEWLKALSTAITAGTLVKLTLSKPTPAAADLKSIDIRPILIKRELKLSFTYHHKTRDIVKNYNPTETTGHLVKLMGPTFTASRLSTTEVDLHLSANGKTYALATHAATQTAAPSLSHDKPKQRLLTPTGKAYLHALGLTDASGAVLKSAQDKFRQINKYIEVLDNLVQQLPAKKPLRIVDMGAGKGYLTFALYDHLTSKLNLSVEVTGVEYRQDLVTLCNDLALADDFTHLKFVQGSIESFDCTGTDVVIALHACDTATDDAIAKAIKANASLIVVAPCCHKQIRREMAASAANPALDFMLKFGTYQERMAEMVTDALRAKFMELSGYTTNLFEFISADHTPKNVMIVASKLPAAPTAAHITHLKSLIADAKAHFGIKTHQLEKLL